MSGDIFSNDTLDFDTPTGFFDGDVTPPHTLSCRRLELKAYARRDSMQMYLYVKLCRAIRRAVRMPCALSRRHISRAPADDAGGKDAMLIAGSRVSS